MVRGDLPPAARRQNGVAWDSDQKLRIGLDGISDDSLVSGLCQRNHTSQAQFYDWRETSLAGAAATLSAHDSENGHPRDGAVPEPADRVPRNTYWRDESAMFADGFCYAYSSDE